MTEVIPQQKEGAKLWAIRAEKSQKTTNPLFITDQNGLPIAMYLPFAGNHNDLFEIESHFQKMLADLQLSDISPDGLFTNAEVGFDSKKMGVISHIDPNKINIKNLLSIKYI